MTSVGFIGGGRVARIVLGGWKHVQAPPGSIAVYDPDPASFAALSKLCAHLVRAESAAEAAGKEVVVLAVHPPAAAEAAAQIAPHLTKDAVLVSFLPKLTCERLNGMLGGFGRIARMIPNAPSIVGAGYNPVAFAPALPEEARELVLALFTPLGQCPVVAENTLEAYAILTGMGPTYFWPQFYALREFAEGFGLTQEAAQEGLERMVAGALRTMAAAGLNADDMLDLIPAKPVGEEVEALAEAYRVKLNVLMAKLKPN